MKKVRLTRNAPLRKAGYKTAICLPITPKSVLATREASIQFAMHPRTDIVDVAALLVAARAVVADPARWSPYPHALDANGHSRQGRSNNAVCWGAAGALDRAAADAEAAERDIADARRKLNEAALRVASGWTGTAWLLDRKAAHAMTVASFDEAIRAMPRPERPGAVDILAIARTLIAHPGRWAQGAIALDRKGRALTTFDGGCRFCAAGAVGLAAHVLGADEAARRGIGPAVDHAGRLLDCAAFKIGEFESYIGLNEHDSHARVVAMFDHALDMARAGSAPGPEES